MSIEKAIEDLMNHKVVGIPTETVYGLAGRIDSETALKKIFSTKKRPFFDPLIVHVSDLNQIEKLVNIFPSSAKNLARKFWPGPLTLVLEKSEYVSDLITAGLPRVGIRMPNHPLTLELISKLNIPLAAPSANKFGKTSPTKAAHVRSEFEEDDVFVLDGGDCQVGVESTVLYLKQKNETEVEIAVLRLGMISENDILKALKDYQVLVINELDSNLAPGNMKHHYMPNTPMIMVEGKFDFQMHREMVVKKFSEFDTSDTNFEFNIPKKFETFTRLELDSDPTLAARTLYSQMRNLSDGQFDFIVFEIKSDHKTTDFAPIFEKIRKASSFILSL